MILSYYKKVANNSAHTNELNTLNANIIAINKLKNKNKRSDIGILHKQLVKTNSAQDHIKEDLLKKNTVRNLKTEGKIVNKLNRNKDSFQV